MNTRFTSATFLGLVFIGAGISGCDKSAPTPPAPPVNNARTPTPPPTPPPIHLDAKPTPPIPPPTTAPISMKPTDVHPTTSPSTPPTTHAAVPSPPAVPPGDPKVAMFAGLTAPKPATWAAKPVTKQFSVAQYVVPGREGSDQADITVSKAGGTIQANIDRWKSQFKGADGQPVEPKVTKLTADGMDITVVELAGSYSGMSGSFQPDRLFLDAIVETPGEMVFVKFVGPTATVEANRQAFMDMLNGIKRAEPQK